jgi:hypothetical protein
MVLPASLVLTTAACSPFGTPVASSPDAERLGRVARVPGTVEGQLRVIHAHPGEGELGAAVVYLERKQGDARPVSTERPPLVFDGAGRLSPALVAGTVGETIRLVLNEGVLHQPFTISPDGTRLDLTIQGGVGTLALDAPGIQRIYWSLHRSERSLIYAARSPYVSAVDDGGRYGISGVPVGVYRLVLWSEAISGPIRSIEVKSGARLQSPIWIDARKVPR